MKSRVSKKYWYGAGGFMNPRCSRKHNGKNWQYYYEF